MMNGDIRVGEALRSARTARQLSLSAVAEQAGISVATLSRIETNKQNIDVALLIELAAILDVSPASILPNGEPSQTRNRRELLVREFANVPPAERAQLFVDVARQSRRGNGKGDVAAQMETLLTALDLIREELLDMRRAVQRRK